MVRYGKCKSNILVRRWNGFAENFLVVVVVVVLPTIVTFMMAHYCAFLSLIIIEGPIHSQLEQQP